MSYNGIGLPTPRGTGTSGYVQRNVSSVSSSRQYRSYERRQERARVDERRQKSFDARNFANRAVDEGILEHERKRKIEAKCVQLRVDLEDEREEAQAAGKRDSELLTDDEIEERVDKLREKLKREEERKGNGPAPRRPGGSLGDSEREQYRSHDVHNIASAKARENEKLKDAFESDRHERNKRSRHRERSLSPVREGDKRPSYRDRSRSPDHDRGRRSDDRRRGDHYLPNSRYRGGRDYESATMSLNYDDTSSSRPDRYERSKYNSRRDDYSRSPSPNRGRSQSPDRKRDPRNSRIPPYRQDRPSEPPQQQPLKKYSLPGSLPPAPYPRSEAATDVKKKSTTTPSLPPKPQSKSVDNHRKEQEPESSAEPKERNKEEEKAESNDPEETSASQVEQKEEVEPAVETNVKEKTTDQNETTNEPEPKEPLEAEEKPKAAPKRRGRSPKVQKSEENIDNAPEPVQKPEASEESAIAPEEKPKPKRDRPNAAKADGSAEPPKKRAARAKKADSKAA